MITNAMKSQPCGKKAYIPKLTLSKVILNFKDG
jgi:hypothetical protein